MIIKLNRGMALENRVLNIFMKSVLTWERGKDIKGKQTSFKKIQPAKKNERRGEPHRDAYAKPQKSDNEVKLIL